MGLRCPLYIIIKTNCRYLKAFLIKKNKLAGQILHCEKQFSYTLVDKVEPSPSIENVWLVYVWLFWCFFPQKTTPSL